MAKEPRVIIIQTTSEQEADQVAAREAGIENPGNAPGGGFGGNIVGKFKVKVENGRGHQGFLTAEGYQLTCNLL